MVELDWEEARLRGKSGVDHMKRRIGRCENGGQVACLENGIDPWEWEWEERTGAGARDPCQGRNTDYGEGQKNKILGQKEGERGWSLTQRHHDQKTGRGEMIEGAAAGDIVELGASSAFGCRLRTTVLLFDQKPLVETSIALETVGAEGGSHLPACLWRL